MAEHYSDKIREARERWDAEVEEKVKEFEEHGGD